MRKTTPDAISLPGLMLLVGPRRICVLMWSSE